MTISSGDILRIAASFVWDDGNLAMNVFNALISGAGGPWDDADVIGDAVDWMDFLYTELVDDLTDDINPTDVEVYKWDAVGLDWDEVGTDPWGHVFTGAGEYLPRGVACLINAPTTDPDVNGKKYLPGGMETLVANGLWTGAFVAELVTWGTAWVEAFTGGTSLANFQPGVWSVKNSAFFPFRDAFSVGTIPAYQRRRKRGVGA